MNAEETIYDKSLYAINQTQTPRVVYLTSRGVREGQIVTTLDASIPNVEPTTLFPNALLRLFYGNVPMLHSAFKDNVPWITQIETPEEAALFMQTVQEILRFVLIYFLRNLKR